ncbi:MAG TPA: protein kinase [Acidimicrobiia bacterium]|nr:protein kinase [Acidimicrobiia bacterium]
MPASIPDRFSLEVRLGRDGDIEEWLATDTSLDRPVLIRSLGPESSAQRRQEFVESVSNVAKTAHSHLARVFAVSSVEGGAYAVSEWTGGATVADRVAAEQPIDLPDFLPNAAGLAGALAAIHATGAVHGGIDTSAISYSGAHLAKLGAFGRPQSSDASDDVRALAAALETALTGSPPVGPPPSERVDGVPRAIDTILRAGQSGSLTADDLEKALRAAPTPRPPRPESGPTSKRLLIAAIGLVVVAVGLVVVGFVLSGGSAPVVPTPTTQATSQTTVTTLVTTTVQPGEITVSDPTTLDPFGEGGENDQLTVNLTDGDVGTEWLTERYLDPLPLIKPGVGVTVRVEGTPRLLELVGLTEDTRFEVYWSNQRLEDPAGWDRVAGASASPGSTFVELPPRADGFWLIWLTEIPPQGDGTYRAALAELRFVP